MMKAISFTLPAELLQQVDAIAAALGRSRAEMIRSALTRDLLQSGDFTKVQDRFSQYQIWLKTNTNL